MLKQFEVTLKEHTPSIKLDEESILKMLLEYEPTETTKIINKCIKRAKKAGRLSIDKKYQCVFK